MRHPPPSAALRGPTGSSTEDRSGTARMRHSHPVQRFVAPSGSIGSTTEGPSVIARMRHPHPVQRFVAP
eukprot:4584319-Pyramimonas_sp.AAC.1